MTTFYLKAKEARKIADALAFCMSRKLARYYLNGVYIHISDGKLFAVAMDGHRMGRLRLTPVDGGDGKDKPIDRNFGAIIPREAVLWLGKLDLPKKSDLELVRFDFTKSDVTLTLLPDNLTETFPLRDGSYPDYERCIPPKRHTDMVAGFNGLYLADIGKAVRKVTANNQAPLSLHLSGPANLAVVTCDYESLIYVQMPMRV